MLFLLTATTLVLTAPPLPLTVRAATDTAASVISRTVGETVANQSRP